jgi:lipoprotein-releasing system ATP-binding protein
VLEVSRVSKSYPTSAGELTVLRDVTFTLNAGDAACVMGPSGSGKSTLLYTLGGLEPPSSGTVRLGSQDPYTLTPPALASFRNRHVGFVFQDHCLLPQCTVLENVLIPTLVGSRADDDVEWAKHLVDHVGLASRLDHRPAELSGGEKQRAAVARALVRHPTLVLCDEPTGNLDADTASTVSDLILRLHREQRTLLIVVTHSAELARRFDRRWTMSRGQLNG